MKAIIIFFSLLVYGSHLQGAHLVFQPNIPVQLVSKVEMTMEDSLSGITHGNQTLEATLILSSTDGFSPLTVAFTLENLKINLNVNDEIVTFDSKKKEPSLYLNQLSWIINNPISIQVKKKSKIKSKDLQKMLQEMPILRQVNAEQIFQELFLHLFTLYGEELKEGEDIVRDLSVAVPTLPQRVKYTITKVDDYNIYAQIQGSIEEKEIRNSPYPILLDGHITGKIRWNRDQAMLYQLHLSYDYTLKGATGENPWMIRTHLDLDNRTQIKTENN